ncbi:RNA polymerase sigma factor [Frondihabitans australicus]|uniref:RNA polymerase ECF family sigma subunit n=1 Tax=Frondihabitans australicus TaxID=386892 RepID=A0A495IFG9_9MICO|nr:RNA polymerase sigma factor [Frondihabitans australicus]RKR74168.1 RNA polymerase ECF family sigma subunit [Frondihabitans australicus]
MPGTTPPDDEVVWNRARDGDADAFTEIYDRHYDRVYRHSLRLAPTVHDTEDVAALVFLEAWRRRAHVRVVDGSVLPWLLVTANYVSANASRSARRHRVAMAKLPLQESVDDSTDDVLDRIDSSGRESRLRAAFAQLAPNDRDVLTLCVVHELPLQQAADVLRVPVGTVKSRLSRAKRRLATLTGPDLAPSLSAIATMGEHQ